MTMRKTVLPVNPPIFGFTLASRSWLPRVFFAAAGALAFSMSIAALAQPAATATGSTAPAGCQFPWKSLPAGTKVFAGTSWGNGADAGFPIDTSGFNASYRDVVVDQPGIDVALLLSMSGANIWRISWTPGTRIVAVWASGDRRQAVVGIPRSKPLLMTGKESPCGSFTFFGEQFAGARDAALKAFGLELTGQFTAQYGRTLIGAAHVRKDVQLLSSSEIKERSYESQDGYAYGRAGMNRLERDGYVRRAIRREFVAWKDGWRQRNGLPPAAPEPYPDVVIDHYVVLRPFELPKGLHGSNLIYLIVPAGMKPPTGDPGHSVFSFVDGYACKGAVGCPTIDEERLVPVARAPSSPTRRPPSDAPAPVKTNANGLELIQASDFWIRSTGKWYFEVSYDVGTVAREMKATEAYVMIGCITGKEPRGLLGRIGQEHKQRPVRHIGIAVDFEKRLITQRVNGEWSDGDPLADGGIPFPREGTTLCGVMSTEDIRPILSRPEVMQVNWGEKPFRSLPPAGYKGYGQGLVF